jgi:hypothetical protein
VKAFRGKTIYTLVSLILLALSLGMAGRQPAPHASSPVLPVFPGAEGFGTDTPAGSGRHLSPVRTTVYRVTNLGASGSGTLAECVRASGPRVCVFEVSGTIPINDQMSIYNPYITIAGQTAPSPGITLRGATLEVKTHDVLIQHLRFRVGDGAGVDPGWRDGIAVVSNAGRYDVYNVVIDHCSVSWAMDENVSVAEEGVRDVTISHCIISEGLLWEGTGAGGQNVHSNAMLISDGVKRVSVHHSLLAHNDDRNPRIKPGTETEWVNNLHYNWGQRNMVSSDSGGPVFSNIINNYFQDGRDNAAVAPIIIVSTLSTESKFYVSGNIGPGRWSDTVDDWALVSGDKVYRSSTPVVIRSVHTVQPAKQALGYVLDYAGARPRDRDAVDHRIVRDVQNGTGRLIESQDEVGGWPNLAQNRRTLVLPSNPNGDNDDDGYTNLEEWLHTYAMEIEGLEGSFGINTEPYTHVTDPDSVVDYAISVQAFGALSEDVTLTFSDPSMYLYGSLDRTALGPSDRAMLTVTDTHPGPTLMPGRWYGIFITGTTSSYVRPTKVRILVGGGRAYLPIIRDK